MTFSSISGMYGTGAFDVVGTTISSTREVVAKFTDSNVDILQLYDNLIEVCQSEAMTEKDLTKLCEAVAFAAEKHQDQFRKDIGKTPYLIHPIGVAFSIASEGGHFDVDVLIGAVLHDTVEDTDTKYDELSERFGEDISMYVRECSDEVDELTGEKIYGKKERKRQQVEHAPEASPQAKLIKLGDKLYNLRDMPKDVWSPMLRFEYMTFVENIVIAIQSGHGNVSDVMQMQAIDQLEKITIEEIKRVKDELLQEATLEELKKTTTEDWG